MLQALATHWMPPLLPTYYSGVVTVCTFCYAVRVKRGYRFHRIIFTLRKHPAQSVTMNTPDKLVKMWIFRTRQGAFGGGEKYCIAPSLGGTELSSLGSTTMLFTTSMANRHTPSELGELVLFSHWCHALCWRWWCILIPEMRLQPLFKFWLELLLYGGSPVLVHYVSREERRMQQ